MAQITAQMVSQLREQTGAGMMECKKALTEAEGDIEKARDILRAKGQAGATKRAGRAAADGVVAIQDTELAVALIELNSETDFVARNEEFRALAHEIASAAANTEHGSVDELWDVKLANGATIRTNVDDALAKLRENLILKRTARIAKTGNNIIGQYIHRVDNKTGVLVELTGGPENATLVDLAKGIAMHIAAIKPVALSKEEIPADLIKRERDIAVAKAAESGKPANIVEKMVEGSVQKFLKEVTLLGQPFVKDDKQTVEQLLKSKAAQVHAFRLYVVGEGLEKRKDDFVAEVMAQAKQAGK